MHPFARHHGAAFCRFPRNRLSLALYLALALPAGVHAEPADAPLKEVVVTATRQETSADQVPATITTVDREALNRRLPQDEAALFADEPDVAMSREMRRYGSTQINIRGIEGIRVLQQVDGVRLPDNYYGGGPSNITAALPDGADMEFLKRVEILRGPASSLYGSDALGGVVGYLTLDPQDLLQGKPFAARYRATWRGADESLQNTLYGAWGGDSVESLLALTRRAGHETDNQGSVGDSSVAREQPNPLDTRSDGMLAKLFFKPAAGHRVGLVFEGRAQDNDADTLRLAAGLPKVTASSGNEKTRRHRASLEWEWKPAGLWFDRLFAQAYRQASDSHTRTLQTRSNTGATCSASSGTGNNCLVDMDFRFKQDTDGVNLQFESALKQGANAHLLTYGADWSETRTDELRDYWITNQTTATQTKTLAGDTYPLRDFAPGEHSRLGLFAQDEIHLLQDRLQLTPGIRYDSVKLNPDAYSKTAGTLTLSAAPQNHSAVSPKLGVLWHATPETDLYGQIVRGFRAPNYEEVNGLFYNASQSYVTLPNAALEPERSTGLELGSRFKALGGNLSLALFHNRYRNFIDQQEICFDASAPFTCPGGTRRAYQSINLSKVRIEGIELRGDWMLSPQLRLRAGIAHADGRDQELDQPLNTIEPTRLSLALQYDQPAWGGEARLRAATAKRAVDRSTTDYFSPGGYAVADLSAWWRLRPNVRLNAGVNNLFDRAYYLWSDVRQANLANSDAGKSFYTQPGRNLSLALQVDF